MQNQAIAGGQGPALVGRRFLLLLHLQQDTQLCMVDMDREHRGKCSILSGGGGGHSLFEAGGLKRKKETPYFSTQLLLAPFSATVGGDG